MTKLRMLSLYKATERDVFKRQRVLIIRQYLRRGAGSRGLAW